MTFIYQVILLSENLISDNQQFSQYQQNENNHLSPQTIEQVQECDSVKPVNGTSIPSDTYESLLFLHSGFISQF
jgi:hypothetical protein